MPTTDNRHAGILHWVRSPVCVLLQVAALLLPMVVSAQDTAPPATPVVRGIQNDSVHAGTVRILFSAPPGVEYRAVLTKIGGVGRNYKNGEPIFEPGDYQLIVTAIKQSNKLRRSALFNFSVTPPVLAVMDFKAAGGVSSGLAQAASEVLRANVVKTKLFTVVERNNIDKILKEQAFQKSGCTDTSCAVQIGQLLAASKVLMGTVTRLTGRYQVALQIIDVEKSQVEFSETVGLASESDFESAMYEATRKISARMLGVDQGLFDRGTPSRVPYVWRSALLPGWGQLYEGQATKGYFFIGIGAALALNYGSARQKFKKAQADYDSAVGVPASPGGGNTILLNVILIQQKRDSLEQSEKSMNLSALYLAGFWAWNVIDSFLFPAPVNPVALSTTDQTRFSFSAFSYQGQRDLRVGVHFSF